jgi:hypothetical protein
MEVQLQTRWVNRNVDLEALIKRVEEFFKSKGFDTVVEGSQHKYKVAGSMRVDDKPRSFYAIAETNKEGLTVEFWPSNEGRVLPLLGPLISMFGGGVFMLDRYRSAEFYKRLEAEFWAFMENAVEHCSVS